MAKIIPFQGSRKAASKPAASLWPELGPCRIGLDATMVVNVPRDYMQMGLRNKPALEVQACVQGMMAALVCKLDVFERRGDPKVFMPRPRTPTIQPKVMGQFLTYITLWPTVEMVHTNTPSLANYVTDLWEDVMTVQLALAEISDTPASLVRLRSLHCANPEPLLQLLQHDLLVHVEHGQTP